MDNLDDVAVLMTAESGKPLKESKVEATGGCAAPPRPGALRSPPLCCPDGLWLPGSAWRAGACGTGCVSCVVASHRTDGQHRLGPALTPSCPCTACHPMLMTETVRVI